MIQFSPESLVRFRKGKNLSQSRFADEVGVSRQNLSHWEKGVNVPHTESLLKIANHYQLPSLDIFFD